jgi:hypothetical protein
MTAPKPEFDIDELDHLASEATPAPWRAGRSDMTSYDADGSGPFKNVYVDGTERHHVTGELLPDVVARGESERCHANAQLIAALVNAWPAVSKRMRELEEAVAFFDDANEANRRNGLTLSQRIGELRARAESAEARVRELEAKLGDVDEALMKRFRLGIEPIDGVVAFMRANWHNDGAEGEGVHKLCLYAETVPRLLVRITSLESEVARLREEAGRCGKRCDHDSPCTLPIGHLPPSHHETDHGCTFYDDPPSTSALERQVREALGERFASLRLFAAWGTADDHHSVGSHLESERLRTFPALLRAILEVEAKG